MFTRCLQCGGLVATNPVTDEPPDECPRCTAPMWTVRATAKVSPPSADTPPSIVEAVEAAAEAGAGADVDVDVHADADADVDVDAQAWSDGDHGTQQSDRATTTASGAIDVAAVPMPTSIPPISSRLLAPAEPGLDHDGAIVIARATEVRAIAPDDAPNLQPSIDVDDNNPEMAGSAWSSETNEVSADVIPHDEIVAREDVDGTIDFDIDDAAHATDQSDHLHVHAIASTPSTARVRVAPSFVLAAAVVPPPARHRWLAVTAIVVLAGVLSMQLMLADRARLAADARWRPLIASVCALFRCSIPPWREPSAFAIINRDVQPQSDATDVLRVTATFRNDARWAQPWPRLRLTLSDVDGNVVATRDFEPREYLGAAPAQADVPAGQSASIAVDVVEPNARSVAFDFQLH